MIKSHGLKFSKIIKILIFVTVISDPFWMRSFSFQISAKISFLRKKFSKMRENDNRIGQLFILEHLRLQPRDVICINVKYSTKRLKETL